MKNDQMDQILNVLKAKLPFAKLITREGEYGKKLIFYNRSKYSRKCTQIIVVLNNKNEEVRINFIYWPRYWVKVRIIRTENLSSPTFEKWLKGKAEEAKIHLLSPDGFPQLSLN